MSIQFTNKELEAQFASTAFNPTLRMIMLAAEAYCMWRFGEPLYITSLIRPEDKTSVHGYGRGGDADNDVGLDANKKTEIVLWVNWHFTYDPTRPDMKVCMLHEVKGRGGDHLHFQTHPNTVMNGSNKAS
jgi:hypothetical protein